MEGKLSKGICQCLGLMIVQNGQPHGHGTYTWGLEPAHISQYPVYNKYVGDFVAGKRQGFGIFQYASGASYKGQWQNNMKHGEGQYISENGRNYVGRFEKDRMVEQFTMFRGGMWFPFQWRL